MKNKRNEKRGRRPGFPVISLSRLDRFLSFGQEVLAFRAFHRRLLLLGIGLVLTLGTLFGFDEGTDDVVLPPHVAEIAPSLSLPPELKDEVDEWMRRYTTDQRPIFRRYLEREGLYSEMIRESLQRRGMPRELLYLAAIESGFSPRARSRVAATGMWQFMGPTAEAFGLRIDAYVDERRDPVRATEAALDYLSHLHDRFGSWYLAAAAYNAGPSRVAQMVKIHAGDIQEPEDLYWEVVDHLPLETRVYVPKMLAAVLLAQAAEDYGFQVKRSQPVRFERVWVPGGTTLRTIAEAVGVPLGEIRDLNPHLLRGVTPPGEPFGIRVPLGASSTVVASLGGRWRRVNVDD